jgi:hypothetical protein
MKLHLGWLFSLALLGSGMSSAANLPRDPLFYFGTCDASAGIVLGGDQFVIGSDEDNILRIYSLNRPGLPLHSLDLNKFLQTGARQREVDIEGAARISDRIYWIGSHGQNASGKPRQERHRFFATEVVNGTEGFEIKPAGRPYKTLLKDLTSDPEWRRLNLNAASRLAPKEPGALNIESLCPTPDGQLFFGFRNPIPEGKALLGTLLNPEEIVQGKKARLGKPIFLDLGGLGIRGMVPWKSGYLILAGPYHTGQPFQIYRWKGPGHEPIQATHHSLAGFNPEAMLFFPDEPDNIWLVSDDGALTVNGLECKRLENPSHRHFRLLPIPQIDL